MPIGCYATKSDSEYTGSANHQTPMGFCRGPSSWSPASEHCCINLHRILRSGMSSYSVGSSRLCGNNTLELSFHRRRTHGIGILVSTVNLLSLSYNSFDFCRTLQFLVSPHIGSLSDKYGRKRILLLTMVGNILSAIVYVFYSS